MLKIYLCWQLVFGHWRCQHVNSPFPPPDFSLFLVSYSVSDNTADGVGGLDPCGEFISGSLKWVEMVM